MVKALTSKEDVHTLVSEMSVWHDELTVADPAIERIPEPLEGWGGKKQQWDEMRTTLTGGENWTYDKLRV